MNIPTHPMKRLCAAYDQTVADLEKRFPVGHRVEFLIMSGQKNPSTGTIMGCSITINKYGPGPSLAYANIKVRHDQAKPNGRYPFREVPPENIIAIRAPAESTNS